MKADPGPAPPTGFLARILARLSVGRKLLLIYLLDLSAVIFISGILVQESFIAIDFARKELAGTAALAVVDEALMLSTRPSTSFPSPDRLAKAALSVEAGPPLSENPVGNKTAALSMSLRELSAVSSDPGSGSLHAQWQAARRRTAEQSRQLITSIGNDSNLILDPDLDSYYTMSIVVLRYPELVDVVSRIGDLFNVAARSAMGLSPADRIRYFVLEGRLVAVMQGIQADHDQAFTSSTDPQLRQALQPNFRAVSASVDRMRALCRSMVEGDSIVAVEARFQQEQAGFFALTATAWPATMTQLDRLLRARIANLMSRMGWHLCTALFLVLSLLSAVVFVARQITRPLARLSDVAERVRVSGDYTMRAVASGEDEIGRLVVSFNTMLEQLDQQRQEQQELVAQARAANAQQKLIEAMPIAIVVTAIPEHEVLHSNRNADRWIGNGTTDPWASGFEAGVGPRFFQGLADRDFVEQFEVRWQGANEPNWAVLSACRLEYQGRDSVLTTFTPIGHLKQMEQRLELWAKVFEAASEGIVITDAKRSVVTANASFCQSTGHDVAELLGQNPVGLLEREKSADFIDEIWPMAVKSGSWRGEVNVRRRDEKAFPAWLAVDAVFTGTGATSHYIWKTRDITEKKDNEERIHFLAHHDPLTRLPNRQLFLERLRMAMQSSKRNGQKVAVLLIDLDRFKNINDSLGHHVGDAMLRSVAQRMQEAVRDGDTVCRLGGDEFVIALNGVVNGEEVLAIVEHRLMPLIRGSHTVEGAELHISCSVGISLYPDDASDIEDCMRHADVAMYQAKATGRDGVQFFTAELNERAHSRLRVEIQLRHAIEREEFTLHYQPRISARTGDMLGVEALLRWNSAELGHVSPSDFIPIAEESRLIIGIGEWVIDQACKQQAQWMHAGMGVIGVAINVSAVQLDERTLPALLEKSITTWATSPHTIELELTESALMRDVDSALGQLQALKRLGVMLSIDDFGTGYSSLSYLHRFPIDRLKIDRSFVGKMLDDTADMAITNAIIGLGHALGLQVVAEGVETEAVALALRAAECDELQGFLYARGMAGSELSDWLANWRASRQACWR